MWRSSQGGGAFTEIPNLLSAGRWTAGRHRRAGHPGPVRLHDGASERIVERDGSRGIESFNRRRMQPTLDGCRSTLIERIQN